MRTLYFSAILLSFSLSFDAPAALALRQTIEGNESGLEEALRFSPQLEKRLREELERRLAGMAVETSEREMLIQSILENPKFSRILDTAIAKGFWEFVSPRQKKKVKLHHARFQALVRHLLEKARQLMRAEKRRQMQPKDIERALVLSLSYLRLKFEEEGLLFTDQNIASILHEGFVFARSIDDLLGPPEKISQMSPQLEASTRPVSLSGRERTLIERVLKEDWHQPSFKRASLSGKEASELDFRALPHFRGGPGEASDMWVQWQLMHPLLDKKEIRARQEAIREMMTAQVLIEDKPLVIALSEWVPHLPYSWDGSDEGNFNLWEIFNDPPPGDTHWRQRAIEILSRTTWPDTPEGQSQKRLEQKTRTKIIEDVQKFLWALEDLERRLINVNSPRLRALRWVVQSVTQPDHPYGLHGLSQKITRETVLKALQENHLALSLVLRAVREIDTYRIIASYALTGEVKNAWYGPPSKAKAWLTFPSLLSAKKQGGPFIEIIQGHSPRMWREKKASVPISLRVGGPNPQFIILTGPNEEGKTTFLRTAAQLAALACLGSPVPAESMTLTPMTIRAHIRSQDQPEGGKSLFRVQSEDLKKIDDFIRDHPLTLVLLDEMLPGTEADARQILERQLIRRWVKSGALFILATHHLKTTTLTQGDRRIANSHVDQFHVLPDPANPKAIHKRVAITLKNSGWDENFIQGVQRDLARFARKKSTAGLEENMARREAIGLEPAVPMPRQLWKEFGRELASEAECLLAA